MSFVIDNSDDIALAYFLRGSCYVERRDYEKALADLDKVLEMDPQHEQALALKDECARLLRIG